MALFSWQTILALRVLNEVHQRYGVEVSGWRLAIAQLQTLLKGRSFPSLWGTVAVFPNAQEALLKLDGEVYAKDAGLTVGLRRHLEALATPDQLPVDAQLPLFPAVAVSR